MAAQSPLYGMYPWVPEEERSQCEAPAGKADPPVHEVAEGRVRLSSAQGEVEVDWLTFENVLFNLFAGDDPYNPMRAAGLAASNPEPIRNPEPQRVNTLQENDDVARTNEESKTNGPARTNEESKPEGRPGKRARRGKAFDINADGYKWRKYGQKLLTLSQQYREYFRCSHPGCPAKKHVEVVPETGVIVGSSSTPHNHDSYSQFNQRMQFQYPSQMMSQRPHPGSNPHPQNPHPQNPHPQN